MNSQVKSIYKEINDILGLPQIYKGVKFYPLKVGDIDYKDSLYRLFFYPKNYIPDRDILKASYIKYLLYVVQESLKIREPDIDLYKELIKFLCYITKTEETNIQLMFKEHPESKNIFDKVSLHLFINKIEFSEQDFDNIREIVLEQNGSSIEWVESYTPDLEEKLIFMQRGIEEHSLKDSIYAFCCITNLSEEEVCNKTLFQFNSRLEREIILKDYNLFKPLEVTGQLSSKNKEEIFKHYLTHIPKRERYDNVLISLNKFIENNSLNNSEEGGLKFEK